MCSVEETLNTFEQKYLEEKIKTFEQKYTEEIKNKEFYKVPPITIVNGRILI